MNRKEPNVQALTVFGIAHCVFILIVLSLLRFACSVPYILYGWIVGWSQ